VLTRGANATLALAAICLVEEATAKGCSIMEGWVLAYEGWVHASCSLHDRSWDRSAVRERVVLSEPVPS
jgi:hypothetical protein